ncbi:hypothetical protein IWW45_005619 [Coemansia sp. RSA 485]|nr:hypothetical protein IWW45_005619 [Coemansia sp. RSA 485]
MEKNKEAGKFDLSPAWKHACISIVAIIANVSIGSRLLHYISRSVASMRILNSSSTGRLQIYYITGRGTRFRDFATAKMYLRYTLHTGKGLQGVTRADVASVHY